MIEKNQPNKLYAPIKQYLTHHELDTRYNALWNEYVATMRRLDTIEAQAISFERYSMSLADTMEHYKEAYNKCYHAHETLASGRKYRRAKKIELIKLK
jgi:hypothetical protein